MKQIEHEAALGVLEKLAEVHEELGQTEEFEQIKSLIEQLREAL
ncbi:hypothetical protein [Maridesulfovibrio sp.]